MHCLYSPEDEILLSIKRQILSFQGRDYAVSTSKFGIGSAEGSNKTPLGSFQVSEKFGSGDPLFTTFKGRENVGTWTFTEDSLADDGILTRIIRLSGLDPENHNTFQRYIYIHGTNDEEGIGHPKSIGCIRMKNAEIITLFNAVRLGTKVKISE